MRVIHNMYGDPDTPPIWEQFWNYLVQLVHLDLGRSIMYYPMEVTDLVSQALPWTLFLGLLSTLIGWVIGTYLGARLGWRPPAAGSTPSSPPPRPCSSPRSPRVLAGPAGGLVPLLHQAGSPPRRARSTSACARRASATPPSGPERPLPRGAAPWRPSSSWASPAGSSACAT